MFSSQVFKAISAAAITVVISSAVRSSVFNVGQGVLKQFEQNQGAILTRVQAYKAAGSVQACIDEALKVLSNSRFYSQAQSALSDCRNVQDQNRLIWAKSFAEVGDFGNAMATASGISPGSDAYTQAQELIQQWASRDLDSAYRAYWEYSSTALDQAVAIARTIPKTSPNYGTVQQTIQRWQTEWANNERHLQAAQEALGKGKVAIAFRETRQITDHPFWQEQTASIVKTIDQRLTEQEYQDLYQLAKQHLQEGELENAWNILSRLPDQYPWLNRKEILLARIDAVAQRQAFCKSLPFWFWSCQ